MNAFTSILFQTGSFKMSKLSKEKEEKIMSHIISVLFENSPSALFTADISKSIVRDEEFTKRLLQDLHKKGLVIPVTKNPEGIEYARRQRWRLSNEAFKIYKQKSSNNNLY